jgi:hypothetical protein
MDKPTAPGHLDPGCLLFAEFSASLAVYGGVLFASKSQQITALLRHADYTAITANVSATWDERTKMAVARSVDHLDH